MKKYKILQLIDGGFLGGGQANVLSIVNNIDRKLYDCSIAAAGGGLFEQKAIEFGINFTAIDLPKVMRTKYLKVLESLYLKEKYDLVHTHGGVAGFYGRTLKKHNPELKCVHTIHGLHYLNSRSFFRKSLSKTIEQYLVQFTDQTICETQNDYILAVQNKIAEREKTEIIPNGINISRFANVKKNLQLLKQLGLGKGDFVIGNISRFDEQKNQKLVLQAAYFLTRKFPNMKFVFVGGGKRLKKMKELARESHLDEHVVFTDEQENLTDYYSIFDIFVFPTLWEGMPLVLLEAMASRRAIICSHIPNLLEVIKPNYSALTINPYDMDDLFQKISVLYHDPDFREMIAGNALIESTQYDETEIVPKISRVYKEVLSS